MHNRHLEKLENFMQKVEAFPAALPSAVQRRRGSQEFHSDNGACDQTDFRTVKITSL
eukprot:Skav236802  [mRNA]  locus=scaffold1361:633810:633980:- [translate_table: standard]